MTATDFCHLHVHTENSMLDGLATVKEYVNQAKKHGFTSLGITDHGNPCGWSEFYKVCRAAEIEPILGCEFYYVPSFTEVVQNKTQTRFHMTMLARGAEGYRALSQLTTATNRQYYYKPLLDRQLCEALGDATQHLTVLSGCMGSRLSQLLLADDEAAIEELLWWRETFPHFYIEIMHHDCADDIPLNTKLLELAERYDIPHVITNDPHYPVESDAAHHDALLAIQTASDINDPARFKFEGHGYWLKSRKEMYRTIKPVYGKDVWSRGVATGLKIAKESRTRIAAWEKKSWQIPKFPDVVDAYAELKRLVAVELRARKLHRNKVYVNAAKMELRVIKKTGIADFLLITREGILFARNALDADGWGIPVGPGRGSVCGTLVGWLIGLHKINPIKYGLLFERFLNPARPKLPDIDTDFGKARRGEVIEHTINKYGAENTMAVAAYGKMQVKAAFNSIAKSYGIGYLEAQKLNKMILEDEDEEGNHFFLLPSEVDEKYPEMAATLNRLAGVKRSLAAHPAGLIIASPEARIHDQVPEMWIASSKRWVGAFDKKAMESMGLLKQDYLGLRSLDTILECLKIIEWRFGERLDPDSWVPDEEEGDAEVWKMLAEGRTSGVFQMEGSTNQRGCREVKPTCFEDVVSITSLYRTGPIAAGFPKMFVQNRRMGKAQINYLHPLLKPILEETWGVVLYQEQVMDIGRVLAGFDMVQVDEIKEAIKDKSSDEMDRLKPFFIEGCKVTNRISESTAAAIWKIIEGYAGYSYNRSHAVAYTFVTYQTARLKYLYPIEYTTALLRTIENDKEGAAKRDIYMREAIQVGARIVPPHINLSRERSWPHRRKPIIRLGLADYAGIGKVQAQKLLQARPAGGYSTVAEVAEAANNVGVLNVLTKGSALTCLGVEGDEQETERLLKWTFRDHMVRYRERYPDVRLPAPGITDVDVVGMIYKVEHGKTKTDKKYLTWHIRWSVTEAFTIRLWSETAKYWDLEVGSVVRVMGKYEPQWQNISCGNPRMIKVLKAIRLVTTNSEEG